MPSALRLLLTLGLVLPFLGSCRALSIAPRESFSADERERVIEAVNMAGFYLQGLEHHFERTRTLQGFLVDFEDGELQSIYDELVHRIHVCDTGALEMRRSIRSIDERAARLMKAWEQASLTTQNPELMDAARKRRETFGADVPELTAVLGSIVDDLDGMLGELRDHALFLRLDLDREGLAAIADVSSELAQELGGLQERMTDGLERCEAFGGRLATPTGPAPAPPQRLQESNRARLALP